MRIEAFIQARMGSTRLPGKVLKEILGKPLIDFMIERLKQTREIDEIVILTTTQQIDDSIVTYCQQKEIPYFRGSEEDVLDRYYQAALQRKPDAIIRLTADCPLIDPDIVDQLAREFKENSLAIDYLSNTLERTFPRGLDVEVFSFQALEKAFKETHRSEEREHVTVYFYRHPELFHLKNIAYQPSYGHYRWTVDTLEDFTLIRLILEHFYPKQTHFRLKDVLQLLKEYPHWLKINTHIEQKKL